MYIKRIQIKNIRGIADLDLDLERPDGSYAGWTAFAGPNGSGKTTLLRAIGVAMYGGADLHFFPSPNGWVRGQSKTAQIKLTLSDGKSSGVTFTRESRASMSWRRGPPPSPAFLIAYGAHRRVWGRSEESESAIRERTKTLYDPDAALIQSVFWLRNQYAASIDPELLGEERAEAKRRKDIALRILESYFLLHAEEIRLNTQGLVAKIRGQEVELSDISDGYLSILTLTIDILSHMFAHQENLEIEERDGKPCVMQPAVILIDEPETHLHVGWQKNIGFWLKRIFPNGQFLVATHSPFVCQAADEKGLVRLRGPVEDGPDAAHVDEDVYRTVVNGSIDDSVVSALFGLERPHSDEAEKLRERVAELESRVIRDRATQDEVSELKGLRAKLPNTLSAEASRTLRLLEESLDLPASAEE